MSGHTTGPWEATKKRDGTRIVKANGFHRAKVFGPMTVGAPGYSEAEANARLIAAAPEMLETLQDVLAVIEGGDGTIGDESIWAIRAAIAKAGG